MDSLYRERMVVKDGELAQFEDLLWQAVYIGPSGSSYGIPQSNHHFYAVLEHYNIETCTFFTPVGEMGFSLHEVLGLVLEDAPYEEYVPSIEELHLLKKDVLLIYETYWKVLCHFHTCA